MDTIDPMNGAGSSSPGTSSPGRPASPAVDEPDGASGVGSAHPSQFPMLRTAVGHLVRDALRLENALYEFRLGISTRGASGGKTDDWSHKEHLFYATTFYRRVFRILGALRLGPSDTFIDLGCGKGRVACCASLYPLCEVIGIEDLQELCSAAEKNIRLLRGRRAPARIIRGRAEEFDYAKGTVIYMYHPFGPKTFAAVLSRVEKGLRLSPRDLKIVYVNPVHEHVLTETKWLEQYDRWPAPRPLGIEMMHPVSFWRLRTGRNSIKP
jgi:predicted RNA methylase